MILYLHRHSCTISHVRVLASEAAIGAGQVPYSFCLLVSQSICW